MLLDKGKLHIRISSHLLDTDELLKLIVIERLHCLFVEIEVVDCQGKSGIDLLSASDVVGKVIVIVADKVFLKSPLSGLLVVYGSLGGELGYELVVFDPLKSEPVCRAVP